MLDPTTRNNIIQLLTYQAAPKPVATDVVTYWLNVPYLLDILQLNQFTGKVEITKPGPWEFRDAPAYPYVLTDDIVNDVYLFLQELSWTKLALDSCWQALKNLASRNAVDPLVTWLDSLEWDGRPRLRTVFRDFYGSDGSDLEQRAVEFWFLQGIERIRRPGAGCKAEFVLVLVGQERLYKSQFGKDLCYMNPAWFTDQLPYDLERKDAKEMIGKYVVVELGEMSQLGKNQMEVIKHFLSVNVDQYRPSYGRTVVEVPRRAIFYGTSNRLDILKGATGNRRFFPIQLRTKPNAGKIERIAPQLWAEAKYIRDQMEGPFWLSDIEEDAAKVHRENFMETGIYDDRVAMLLNLQLVDGTRLRDRWFTFNAAVSWVLGGGESVINRSREERKVAEALRRQGCDSRVVRFDGLDKVVKAWRILPHPDQNTDPSGRRALVTTIIEKP